MSAVTATRCHSCGADVYRLRHVTSGKEAPIDVIPMSGGNVVIDVAGGIYSMRRVDRAVLAHTSHFATCPQADQWRKK